MANFALVATLPPLNEKNINEFFSTLENMAALAEWTDVQSLRIAFLKLEGAARSYISSIQLTETIQTLEILKSKLNSHFRRPGDMASSLQSLHACRQGSNELVRDFASRLETKVRSTLNAPHSKDTVTPTFVQQFLLSLFKEGVQPHIKSHLVINNPPTFEEATELARRVEDASQNFEVAAAAAVPPPGDVFAQSLALVAKQLEKLSTRLDKIEQVPPRNPPNSRPNNQRVPICYYCGIKGHVSLNCRKRQQNREAYATDYSRQQYGYNPRYQPPQEYVAPQNQQPPNASNQQEHSPN
jgi:hypothetical protein